MDDELDDDVSDCAVELEELVSETAVEDDDELDVSETKVEDDEELVREMNVELDELDDELVSETAVEDDDELDELVTDTAVELELDDELDEDVSDTNVELDELDEDELDVSETKVEDDEELVREMNVELDELDVKLRNVDDEDDELGLDELDKELDEDELMMTYGLARPFGLHAAMGYIGLILAICPGLDCQKRSGACHGHVFLIPSGKLRHRSCAGCDLDWHVRGKIKRAMNICSARLFLDRDNHV